MLRTSTTRLIGLFICILFIECELMHAQNSTMSVREADDLFTNLNYAAALPVFLEELKKEPENALLNYKAGVCYLNSRSMKTKSVPFLEKAVLNSTSYLTKSIPGNKEAPLKAYKDLGDAYYLSYNFPAAVKTYQKYKELLKENKTPDVGEIAVAETKLDMCRLVKDLKPQLTLPLAASNGQPCNGDMVTGDYSAALSPDKKTMIYTVKVPVNKLLPDDGSSHYFENPLKNLTDTSDEKKSSDSGVRSKKNLELDTVRYASTVGMSFDGQVVLTYKNDDDEGNLYIIKLKDNKWTTPVKVVKGANIKGWEPNETVSADGNTMYFVSDRPGGFGGKDLYRCTKLPDGEWSKAVNLGPSINTEADEVAPFIHPDNGTLYFSSNRIKQSSYDIFASMAAAGEWAKPSNVGYPINRHDHDIFQVTADNKKLYPAGKPAAEKLNKKDADTATNIGPDSDHFLITFTNQQKIPLNVLKGKVSDKLSKEPLGARITVTDINSRTTIGQYHSDNASGLFSMILPFGKNLAITYEADGYLAWSENFVVNKETNYFEKQRRVSLRPLAEGSTATLTNIFYDGNAEVPNGSSTGEINRVVSFLESHPDVKIELTNYIYTKSDKRFNRKLSEKRAKALKEILVQKGISNDRISTDGEANSPKEPKKEKKKKSEKGIKAPKSASIAPHPTQEMVMEIKKIENQEKNNNNSKDKKHDKD